MNFYDENSTYETFENYEDEVKDILYLKDLYPASFLRWQRMVDDECDKLEFDGSIMFDEFPDKERIRGVVDKIFKMAKSEWEDGAHKEQEMRGCPSDEWLRDFISVLLINEMMRRRNRRRIGRRGFC